MQRSSRSRSRSPEGRGSRRLRYSPSTDARPSGQKANHEASGVLVEDRLKRNGALLKYDEPSDAAMPTRKWRLHVFKGPEQLSVISLHAKSCYRFGRDPATSDIPIEHESCSKQHAAIQHREVVTDAGYGNYQTHQRPYLIDLESTHGTQLNGKRIESKRFVELRPKDIIKFAFSTREYVLLTED